jgi:putative ABC transport system ATP-binding protein
VSTDKFQNPQGAADVTRSADVLVKLDRVGKIYGAGAGQFTALHELSLSIPRGRMVALLGRSGSGKSTLLNLLGAVDRPSSGTIKLAGVDISTMGDEQLALFRRRRLGFVFQSFHLLPSLTAFDNIAVPWLLDRGLTRDRRKQIDALLDRLGLADKSGRYPDELSGGQQQRIALARAVVHRPDLILADEPTGNLDAHSGRLILDLLVELQRDFGLTVVMATHSDEAAARCDDRLILEDGRIIKAVGSIAAQIDQQVAARGIDDAAPGIPAPAETGQPNDDRGAGNSSAPLATDAAPASTAEVR